MNKNVFVFCEQRDGEIQKVAFELVGKARELADALGQEVVGVLAGSNIEGKAAELIAHGADKVIIADDPILAEYSTKPTYVAVSTTKEAKGAGEMLKDLSADEAVAAIVEKLASKHII